MPRPAQVLLAAVIATSTIGSLIAMSPPHPDEETISEKPDAVWFMAVKSIRMLTLAPFVLAALHTCSLACFFPHLPRAMYRYGKENKLNTSLITWSAATCVPLVLILCFGIPMRLISYAWLGKNFTFALKEPDGLVTDGIYHYVQHPSYLGGYILISGDTMLLLRIDGVLSCWVPPQWYQVAKKIWWWYVTPAWLSLIAFTIYVRISQEESMLLATFGTQWEKWHATTARFIPGFF